MNSLDRAKWEVKTFFLEVKVSLLRRCIEPARDRLEKLEGSFEYGCEEAEYLRAALKRLDEWERSIPSLELPYWEDDENSGDEGE